MARCGCASDQCACTIVAGENVSVSGTGSRNNPYVVSAATQVVDEAGNPTGGGSGDRLPGEMTMWGGTSAPAGWLMCNGQAVNRAVYASLYAVLGTKFGAGDGSTTFNLPNLSGRFPMGATGSNPVGQEGGTNQVTLNSSNLPAHAHSMNHDHAPVTTTADGAHQHTINRADGVGNNATSVAQGNAAGASNPNTGSSGTHSHTVDLPAFTGNTGTTGSGTPVNITPAFAAISFIIKA